MESSHPGSLRLFRAFGIDVFLHWSWFVLLIIQVQLGREAFGNVLWAAAIFIATFAIVVVHEFGHALACRSVGGIADTIILWPLGGIAFARPPERPGPVLWTVAAGPLVNVALIPLTLGPTYLAAATGIAETWPDAFNALWWISAINILLLVLNMLPIYPLDGGQIVQAILWFLTGRATSLRIVATWSLIIGVAGGLWLAMNGQIWLAIMCAFIVLQSWQGLQIARYLQAQAHQGYGEAAPWKV